MALFKKTPDEGRPAAERDKDSAALEPGEAAQTPDEVNDRADAVESAATRPLGNDSAEPRESVDSVDHLDGTEGPSEAGRGERVTEKRGRK